MKWSRKEIPGGGEEKGDMLTLTMLFGSVVVVGSCEWWWAVCGTVKCDLHQEGVFNVPEDREMLRREQTYALCGSRLASV